MIIRVSQFVVIWFVVAVVGSIVAEWFEKPNYMTVLAAIFFAALWLEEKFDRWHRER